MFPRQIHIVRHGKFIELHSSLMHLHEEEAKHRLTLKTLTSIRTAVKHNITKSATEITFIAVAPLPSHGPYAHSGSATVSHVSKIAFVCTL